MKALATALAALGLAALYLLAWPTGMAPVAWTPPPTPALEGNYAPNERLKNVQRLAEGVASGPVVVNTDAIGQLMVALRDGRIVNFTGNGGTYTVLDNTGGHPTGITFGPFGGLVISDARKGLLHLGAKFTTLATEAGGSPVHFASDTDNPRLDKYMYFTDASSKFGPWNFTADLLEHGANGRLLQYDFLSKQTRVLLGGLHFPSGVAVGPDDNYVLVSEAGEYRVLRYWLKGEKAGTHEVFIDNLPGFPGRITYNDHGLFWLALPSPRNAALDELLPGNFFERQVLGRLPAFLIARETRHAFVLGIDLDGKVVANLQYEGSDAYAPITSVREHGPWLYFGCDSCNSIGRIPLDRAIPGAQPPPAGWEQVPVPKGIEKHRSREDEEEEQREGRGTTGKPNKKE